MVRTLGWCFRATLSLSVIPVSEAIAGQAVIYVDGSATGAQNGLSWCSAYRNLQDGLAHAASSGGQVVEIRVANGVHRPDRGNGQTLLNRLATFRMVRGVTVRGAYAGCGAPDPNLREFALHETELSGDLQGNDGPAFSNYADNSYHVVTCDDSGAGASTGLDGFLVTGGFANGTLAEKTDQGSGFHNFNGINPFTGKPTVRNCHFVANWSANHGAFNDHGGAVLIDCDFRDNYAAGWGGGLYIHGGLSATVEDCLFYNNRTDGTLGGGGAVASEAGGTFTGCHFEANDSVTVGGALYIHDGAEPQFRDCVFLNNRATDGGAAYITEDAAGSFRSCTFQDNISDGNSVSGNSNGGGAVYTTVNAHPSFVDCAFKENFAVQRGGAIYTVEQSAPTFVNCVLRDNLAQVVGGGLASYSAAAPTFVNCMFNSNRGTGDGGAVWSFQGSQSTFVHCTFFDNWGQSVGGLSTGGNSLTVSNSVVWGNPNSSSISTEASQFRVTAGTLNISHSCVHGWSGVFGGTGNHGMDPQFIGPLGFTGQPGPADGALQLRNSSPCMDAALNANVPSDAEDVDNDGNVAETLPTDLGHHQRVLDLVVDMGAYEGCDHGLYLADMDDDGRVNFEDITLVVYVFRMLPVSFPTTDADISPCGGNGVVNFQDINATVNAFRGIPPCPSPCN